MTGEYTEAIAELDRLVQNLSSTGEQLGAARAAALPDLMDRYALVHCVESGTDGFISGLLGEGAAEIRRLREMVVSLAALHADKFTHDGDSTWGRAYCKECDVPQPCATVLAVGWM